MPLYFGLPVSINEAFRIVGINIEGLLNEIVKEKEWDRRIIEDGHLVYVLNSHLTLHEVTLEIFSNYKGHCIIGYEIQEIAIATGNSMNVDEFILLLTAFKARFKVEMTQLDADLSAVELNGDIVQNPVPYVMSI